MKRIAFLARQSQRAQDALAALTARLGQHHPAEADVIVALGGDGFLLETLRGLMLQANTTPVYGINFGETGFLMNDTAAADPEALPECLALAQEETIHPLLARATTSTGDVEARAINEVSVLRASSQAARLRVSVDGAVRLERLICDGLIVATPAGSPAYNFSAQGPILPLSARVLALTPLSPFRPRHWRGALLRHDSETLIEAIDPQNRPIMGAADNQNIPDVLSISVREDRGTTLRLLFNPGHALEERILREQFSPIG